MSGWNWGESDFAKNFLILKDFNRDWDGAGGREG